MIHLFYFLQFMLCQVGHIWFLLHMLAMILDIEVSPCHDVKLYSPADVQFLLPCFSLASKYCLTLINYKEVETGTHLTDFERFELLLDTNYTSNMPLKTHCLYKGSLLLHTAILISVQSSPIGHTNRISPKFMNSIAQRGSQ